MQRKTARWAAAGAVMVAASITILQLTGLWRPIGIVLEAATKPILKSTTGAFRSLGDEFQTLGSLGSLSKQNRQLEQDLVVQKSEVSRLRELEIENRLLREQLSFQKDQARSLIGSQVIGYGPDNVRRTLVLDRGTRDGVAVGQAVVSSGVLVGRVDRVSDQTATVFLVSDPDFRVQAIAQSERARGIVRGQLGSGLRFEQIAQSETVSPNEDVLTAGSDKIPKGILIGKIDSIAKSDNEVFQAAQLRSPLNVSRLEIVFVVKG